MTRMSVNRKKKNKKKKNNKTEIQAFDIHTSPLPKALSIDFDEWIE